MTDQEVEQLCSSSADKVTRLREALREMGSVLVSFSGGVDSTFLLKVAIEELGDRCLAFMATSESMAQREQQEAVKLIQGLGARYQVVQSQELANQAYAANPVDRCYFCKRELFDLAQRCRAEQKLAVIVDGFNADDRGDWRPGQRAGKEHGVRSPLAEVGLGKKEIRAWSRRLGLPTWDKPQMACLASRLPYGTAITAERLKQIDDAEQDLWNLGLRQFRVRWHGELARVEIAGDEYQKLLEPELRQRAASAIKKRGFKFVALDLEPFRSGRMNEAAGI